MKPTYGRVSRYGLVAFASSLDQIGPLTKDAEDMALALNVICGKDPLDATSADKPVPDFTQSLQKHVAGLTIGLPRECFDHALSDDMRVVLDRAIDALRENGAKTVEVSLPHTKYAVATYYIICTAEASANLARFDGVRYGFRHPGAKNVEEVYALSKSEGFGPEVQRRIMLGTYALSSGYYDAYYKKAQQVRTLIRRDFDHALEQCDLILTPVTRTPAFKIGEKADDPLEMYLTDIYTTSINLTGVPGLSVPCGRTAAGLPVGMQLVGKPFDEETLIRVACAYEHCRGWAREVAPAA
jgi:aspartyl-tRNA(Asn)/glutamyl-tRNA(Gln) amidotransferase subunit A